MAENQQHQSAEDHYYAALDFYAEGRRQQAISEYEAAIAANPRFLDAMHGLARVYQDMEQFDQAITITITIANRIAELDTDDALTHTSLSILHQRKGMVPEAEAEANKARILGSKQQLRKTARPPQ
jgi:tetratricopeptide (TPR) repeat protein